MTVNVNLSIETFPVNAPNQTYSFGKQWTNIADFLVVEINSDNARHHVNANDWSLTGGGPPPLYEGGVITVDVPHLSDTITVEIARQVQVQQLVDYVRYGSFPAETHEYALDKLTLIMQDVDANTLRDVVLLYNNQVVEGFKIWMDGLAQFVRSDEGSGVGGFIQDVTVDADVLRYKNSLFTTYQNASFEMWAYQAGVVKMLKGDELGRLTWEGYSFFLGDNLFIKTESGDITFENYTENGSFLFTSDAGEGGTLDVLFDASSFELSIGGKVFADVDGGVIGDSVQEFTGTKIIQDAVIRWEETAVPFTSMFMNMTQTPSHFGLQTRLMRIHADTLAVDSGFSIGGRNAGGIQHLLESDINGNLYWNGNQIADVNGLI
jgi:hypothetical protein